MKEKKKLTRLLSAGAMKEGESHPKVASWEMSAFLSDEEKLQQELAQEEAEVEQIKVAQETLEKIKEEARQAGYQAGFDQGYQAGYSEGKAQASEEIQTAIEKQKNTLTVLAHLIEQPLAFVEENVYQQMALLSIALAEKITQSHIQSDETFLQKKLEEALKQLPEIEAKLEVFTHPEDHELVKTFFSQHPEWAPKGWQWSADPSLERGALKVKHLNSWVMNDWKAQMEEYLSQVSLNVMPAQSSNVSDQEPH